MWKRHTLALILALIVAAGLAACGDDDDDDSDDATADDDDSADDDDDDSGDPATGPARYVVVAADGLLDSVQALVAYRESLGYEIVEVTVGEIEAQFADSGLDRPTAIRMWLKLNYVPDKRNFLLLVGSHQTIPMPLLKPDPIFVDDYQVYTDYFYADVHGNFDADGDGVLGEWYDDDYDLWPEYLVGRIPWDEPERIAALADDIVWFETVDDFDFFNHVMLGAVTVAIPGDASLIMSAIRDLSLAPTGYASTTFFEPNPLTTGDFPFDSDTLKTMWPQWPAGLFMFAAHGNDHEAGGVGYDFLTVDDIPYYRENIAMPGVVMSTACRNLKPDRYDNLGAEMLGSCAVSIVGSTSQTDPGPVGEGSIVFLAAVDRYVNSGLSLIEAVNEAKEVYMWVFFKPGEMRYDEGFLLMNFLGFVVYGDPALTYPTTPRGEAL